MSCQVPDGSKLTAEISSKFVLSGICDHFSKCEEMRVTASDVLSDHTTLGLPVILLGPPSLFFRRPSPSVSDSSKLDLTRDRRDAFDIFISLNIKTPRKVMD